MYITPTNKDQQGKEFILTVTGKRWNENKYDEGKRDREVLNDETNSKDVVVLTDGWFKDSNLENVKVGDRIKLCFDKDKDEWFNVEITSGKVDENQAYSVDEDTEGADSSNGVPSDPIDTSSTSAGPDWDKIAAGKVRHAFSLAAFNMNWECDQRNKDIIEAWVKFVMGEDLPF